MSQVILLPLVGVLLLLWVFLPFIPREHANLAWAHMALVAALAALAALAAWRRRRPVLLGVSFWVVLVACASLFVATLVEPGRFPHAERWWTANTSWAHALFLLSALVLVPAHSGTGDVFEHRFDPEVAPARRLRLALVWVLLALVAAQALAMLPQVRAGERPTGSLGNPNILGATLAAAALAVAAFVRWRVLAWLLLAGVLALILSTGSRGALLATSVVAAMLALRRSVKTVLSLTLVLVLVLVFVPNPLTERLLALHSDHQYSRLFFWKVALQNIASHPLGIGTGMNRYVFPPLAFDPEHPWLLHQRHAVGLTHNLLLTTTLEWGWLAGAALLSWLLWAGARILRWGENEALGRGAALGAGVLFLEAQVDGVEQNPLAFSLLLFLVAVALRRVPAARRGLAVPARLAAVALAVAALLMGRQALERGRRDLSLADAGAAVTAALQSDPGSAAEAADFSRAETLLTRAEQLAADQPGPHRQRFVLLEEQLRRTLDQAAERRQGEQDASAALSAAEPLVRAAWAALERARAADPADPRLCWDAARFAIRLYRRGGHPPAMLESFFLAMADVLSRDPLDVEARWEVAQEAQRAGRLDIMEAQCKVLFELEPDDALAWYALGVSRELAGDSEGAARALQRAVEAIYNCRLKLAIDNPASQAYYQAILDRLGLAGVRRVQARLRRRLYG